MIGQIYSAIKINENIPTAGRAKVIKYQLNSLKRKELCRLQGVEYSSNSDDIEHPAAEKCYGDKGVVGSSSQKRQRS